MRPTADKVRGAIFNILTARDWIEGRRVLDLFAGSGALGIDALSRGASAVTFIDDSVECCRAIRDNLERNGFGDGGRILRAVLPRGLKRLELGAERFGGVLLDPPYRRGLAQASLETLGDGPLLEKDAWVIVEHAAEEGLAERYGGLRLANQRRYGSTAVSLYTTAEER